MIKNNLLLKNNRVFSVKSLAILLIVLFLYIQTPSVGTASAVTNERSNGYDIDDASLQNILNDLNIAPQQFESVDTAPTPDNYNVFPTLRDNINQYTQVWNPWLTRAGVHVAEVSEDLAYVIRGAV